MRQGGIYDSVCSLHKYEVRSMETEENLGREEKMSDNCL